MQRNPEKMGLTAKIHLAAWHFPAKVGIPIPCDPAARCRGRDLKKTSDQQRRGDSLSFINHDALSVV
jgi:hypothetical protein